MKFEVKHIVDDEQRGMKVYAKVWYDNFHEDGGFLVTDQATDGQIRKFDGDLYFEGSELVDYDGVFDLPMYVLDLLESSAEKYDMPVDVTHMRSLAIRNIRGERI